MNESVVHRLDACILSIDQLRPKVGFQLLAAQLLLCYGIQLEPFASEGFQGPAYLPQQSGPSVPPQHVVLLVLELQLPLKHLP